MSIKYPTIKVADAADLLAEGSKPKLAKVLGCTKQNVYVWGEYLPELYAYRVNSLIQQKGLSLPADNREQAA